MEWYEDPIRARDEVRKAHWRGAWRMLGFQLAVLIPAAVLYPAFHSMHVGPKLTAESVAGAIGQAHQETGRWPTTFSEVQSRIHFDDRIGPHHVAFVKVAGQGGDAEYAVMFDRSLRAFRFEKGNRAERTGERTVFGTLYP